MEIESWDDSKVHEYEIIKDTETIKNVQLEFEKKLKSILNKEKIVKIGFPGNSKKFEGVKVYYSDYYPGFWYYTIILPNGKIYNSFGPDNSSNSCKTLSLKLALSTKAPFSNHFGGLFLKKGDNFYIAHNGTVSGGKKGVGKSNFLKYFKTKYPDKMQTVDNDKKSIKVILISCLENDSIVNEIVAFMEVVEQFKRPV
ncbi:MAG: hypothetical protein LBM99_04825 [Bacillales bacterium]|nr:hypothetical protein [Bacillales bacterium]